MASSGLWVNSCTSSKAADQQLGQVRKALVLRPADTRRSRFASLEILTVFFHVTSFDPRLIFAIFPCFIQIQKPQKGSGDVSR